MAEKLGYYGPGSIQNKFVPRLAEGGKMAASDPMLAIFTVDSPKMAKNEVMNAFRGGRTSAKEQRELGGSPDIASVFMYYKFVSMPDDRDLQHIEQKYRGGEILCGECKQILVLWWPIFSREIRLPERRQRRVDEFSASHLRDEIRR